MALSSGTAGTIRANWAVEGAFAFGLFLCLAWRYAFPNIDVFEERFPDLVFIHNYYSGPSFPRLTGGFPFKDDFYYSFQYHSAALLGRWFDLDWGVCYQFAYCIISGLIACSVFSAARRWCAWKPASWVITGALMLGGCGLALVVHLSMTHYIEPLQMARYLGMVWEPHDRTPIGHALDQMMHEGSESHRAARRASQLHHLQGRIPPRCSRASSSSSSRCW